MSPVFHPVTASHLAPSTCAYAAHPTLETPTLIAGMTRNGLLEQCA